MGQTVSAAGTCNGSQAPPPSNFVFTSSQTTPDFQDGKLYADPNYGFDGKVRKEREPPMTKDELRSAKIEPKWRDFCAHKMIAHQKCCKDNFPFLTRCHHAKHELEECQYNEYIIRMKEYERERRLLIRKQRKEKKNPCDE